ncbi:hypothetical protein MTBBW1_50051 [Desulfamplus magnetovallimortis]|uniref:Transglutaminase-like domain-containing protein n=1 Tax=Desulfamplus magnetovallimortis TaxID=1246637 RepID=A0A1W1HHS6_9BACT|nr:hypothetical protein [Desulfamplus magnetovallimortis]SLM31928.1 hypothetical protein MTBBW1_50051 [Desulfamplus magnetovallimortis]
MSHLKQLISITMLKNFSIIISILFIANICYGVNIRHDVSERDYIEFSQNISLESGLVLIASSVSSDSVTSYEILTPQSSPITIHKDEYVIVFGSSIGNNDLGHTIYLESGGRAEFINFIGQNIIDIEDNASDFTVYRSGATVYLKNGVSGTQIKIPATKTAQKIIFIEGNYNLLITGDKVLIGDQEITLNETSLNNDICDVTLDMLKISISQLKNQPSNEALQNITNYVSESNSKIVTQALYHIMEYENSELLAENQNRVSNIIIDGEIFDWANVENIHEDHENDITAIDSSLPIGAYLKSDDLKKDGVIHGNSFIYCMLEPFEMPQNEDEYHYRINILTSDNKLVYAFVWTNYGNFIQEWDTQNGTFIRNIDEERAEFAKKTAFEAKIPTDKLNNMPEYYHTQAVVWHEYKNSLDSNYIWSLDTSIENRYGYRYSLDVFCQYAEKIDLTPNDPFPIIQAITEGYIYKLAENEIRPTVIDDGLEMIKQSAKSMEYCFSGQIPLTETSIEALLLWADRSIMFGGYRGTNLDLLKSGRLNKDAYDFLILKPSVLDISRAIIQNNGLMESEDLANTMLNIENFLWQKNKYRRYYIEDILALYESNPEYWAVVYEESLQELETGDINITTVNGTNINKGAIFSASFQVDYLNDYGIFYGNCVDVTAVATAFHKAIGIPSTFFTYGAVSGGYFKEIHSFPIYYSSQDDMWFNYEKGGNGLYGYSSENPEESEHYNVFFTINRPQIGSDWKMFYKESDINGNDIEDGDTDNGDMIIISTRSYPIKMTESEWTSINKGYQMNELKKYIFCPVSSYDINRIIE